jgi:hypothetical protein
MVTAIWLPFAASRKPVLGMSACASLTCVVVRQRASLTG